MATKTKRRLERLTAAQAAMIPTVRDEWLHHGLATGPADREAALRGVADAYRAAGLEPPRLIIWLRSPLEGAIGAWMLKKIGQSGANGAAFGEQVREQVRAQVGEQVREQVREQVWAQVGEQVREQVREQVWEQVREQVRAQVGEQVREQVREQVWEQVREQVWEQVREQVRAQVGAQVREQVWAQVREQVREQVRAQVGAQVREQVWAQVREQVWEQVRAQTYYWAVCYGQHDSSWLGYVDFFRRCELSGMERLDGMAAVAKAAGWWWPFNGAVILTERPTLLFRDVQGRLHDEHGPALLYPCGFAIWAWHGVRVPRHVIEEPGSLTVQQALSEPNAEIRRVMLTRIGPERLEHEGGLRVIDEVLDDQVEIGTGTDGLPVPFGLRGGKLLRMDAKDGMPAMQWVSLLNSTPEPGTGVQRVVTARIGEGDDEQIIWEYFDTGVPAEYKCYWLRVPPTMRSVREAVAWTFGVDAREYQPTAES